MSNIPKHFTTEKTAKVLTITPDLAADWLRFNTANRNISDTNFAKAVKAFTDGQYQFNGDSIRWSVDGRLLDAQHRLTACVETGATFESVVVWGIAPEAQITMDRGKRRTLVDHLRIQGEQSTKELSTTLNLSVAWYRKGMRFGLGTRGMTTFEEAFEYLQQNPNIRASVEVALSFNQKQARKVINASHLAFAHWVLSNIDADDADDFVDRLMHGRHDEETDPVWRLRLRLEDMRHEGGERADEVVALIFKAWNLYREGRHVSQLRVRRGGSAPESFPEPK